MVEMASKKLPREVIEWFRKMGAKGGKKGGSAGGKAAAANLTAKERMARAKNAVAVREAKRGVKRRKSISSGLSSVEPAPAFPSRRCHWSSQEGEFRRTRLHPHAPFIATSSLSSGKV